MQSTKTVLIAGVSDSLALLAAAGRSDGVRAIGSAILRVREVVQSCGGSLVREMGDRVIVLFESPDAAATAAARIHAMVETLSPVGGVTLAAQVGVHSGPVIERDGDVLGDTVNLAQKLVHAAQRGQTVTSEHTASMLTPPAQVHRMYVIPLGSLDGDARLYEITSQPRAGAHLPRAREVLRLKYGTTLVACERVNPRVMIGRDGRCTLAVPDAFASRRHCTVALGLEGFELHDHSTNGTFVTNGGAREVRLQRARLPLSIYGWIALGQPRALTPHRIEFFGN